MELVTTDPEDTRRLAGAIAPVMAPGDVVSLTGELGAGKTCFVQGVAAALGVAERVTSPSFLLRRDYAGRIGLTHLDVYRLETLQESLDLGWVEQADRAVVLIEWGDALQPLLPADHLEVELRLADPLAASPVDVDAPEERRIALRASGDGWRRRLAQLAPTLAPWRRDEGTVAPAGEEASC